MKRQDALSFIRIAGYHGDQRTFMRLYTENRVNLDAAREAFAKGAAQKLGGMTCACHECKTWVAA